MKDNDIDPGTRVGKLAEAYRRGYRARVAGRVQMFGAGPGFDYDYRAAWVAGWLDGGVRV
jgi:ribosome modulation factor